MPSRFRSTLLAATLAAALGALAFAPAATRVEVELTGGTAAVDGIEVTWLLDKNSNTTVPIVLELVNTTGDTGEAGGSGRWVQRKGIGYAYAVLGDYCGDLGGPQDQALISKIGEFLAGARAGDDGTFMKGVNGQVAAYAADNLGHMLLSSVTAKETRFPFAAVATTGAIVDQHDAIFSEGNVRRSAAQLLGPEPELCARPADANNPSVTPYWRDRDLSLRADELLIPSLLVHDAASPYDLGQGLDFWTALRDGDRKRSNAPERYLRLDSRNPGSRWGDPTSGTEILDDFIGAHLLTGSAGATRRNSLASRSRIEIKAGAYSCDTPVTCDGQQTSLNRSGHAAYLDSIESEPLFLNRTFEQDFACVPACVPGPGTGEIGSLEGINRYTAPHAPVFTWMDGGFNSELITADDPLNDGSGLGGNEELPGGHGYHSLYFQTPRVPTDIAIAGRPVLDGWFNTSTAGGTVTPILMDVDLNGATTVIARGALNLNYSARLDLPQHVAGWKPGTITFEGIVHQLGQGHRLAVVLQSHNFGWYERGTAQVTVEVATGPMNGLTAHGSVLRMPILREPGTHGYPFGNGETPVESEG